MWLIIRSLSDETIDRGAGPAGGSRDSRVGMQGNYELTFQSYRLQSYLSGDATNCTYESMKQDIYTICINFSTDRANKLENIISTESYI